AIGVGAAVAVLAVVGVAGYLLWPRGENVAAQGDDATVASAEGTREAAPAGSSPEAPALTVDEEAIVAEFRRLAGQQRGTTPEQWMAAMQKFAADHNMTVEEVLAVVEKGRLAREAANRVEKKWQPLEIGRGPATAWPGQASVSVPPGFTGAEFRTPKVQAPFVLSGATTLDGVERHVFDLNASEPIGRWIGETPFSLHEQVSPDGQLMCAPDGVVLNVLRAADGEPVQQISSPDIHHVALLAFIDPQHLLVLTPLTAERTTDKTRRCLVFDATTGAEVSRFEREFDFVGDDKVSCSPDGRYLSATGRGKSIEVVEIASGEQVCALDLDPEGMKFGQLKGVSFSPDGRWIGVLEELALKAMRLYLIDTSSGELTRTIDLYGSTTTLGAIQADPIAWFPDGRFLLIGKTLGVDTATGRRVWQASGRQSGAWSARVPIDGGLLYQVNEDGASKLVTLPIDFDRIASTQQSWPSDAALAPGMTVSVTVDLSAGGLETIHEVVAAGLTAMLEGQGLTVAETAEKTLSVDMRDGAVAIAWKNGEQTLWESVATDDTALVALLGHMRGKTLEQALGSEGLARLQAYSVPYFVSADGEWTLPVVDEIRHGE
ncbi:MAG: hypothetical protein DWQ29_11690, partial [Planctomycetota bacterium]